MDFFSLRFLDLLLQRFAASGSAEPTAARRLARVFARAVTFASAMRGAPASEETFQPFILEGYDR